MFISSMSLSRSGSATLTMTGLGLGYARPDADKAQGALSAGSLVFFGIIFAV